MYLVDTALGRLKVTKKSEYIAVVDSISSDERAVLRRKLNALNDGHSHEDAAGVATADAPPPLSIQ